jgi:hypothetical protein
MTHSEKKRGVTDFIYVFWNEWLIYVLKHHDGLQIRSIESQVKTKLALWIFILFKVTR